MTKTDMRLLYASVLIMMLRDANSLSLTGKQRSQIESLIIKCIGDRTK